MYSGFQNTRIGMDASSRKSVVVLVLATFENHRQDRNFLESQTSRFWPKCSHFFVSQFLQENVPTKSLKKKPIRSSRHKTTRLHCSRFFNPAICVMLLHIRKGSTYVDLSWPRRTDACSSTRRRYQLFAYSHRNHGEQTRARPHDDDISFLRILRAFSITAIDRSVLLCASYSPDIHHHQI